jgi:F0F1-type ATP synthase assembly protein I
MVGEFVMGANPYAVAARRSLLLLAWQLGCLFVIAMVCAIALSARAAGSLLIGGGIGLVWTVYMALMLFKHSVSYGARVSALSIFKAWLVKVVMTMVLLVIAFRAERLLPVAVLGGLFTSMVAYWAWFAFNLEQRGTRTPMSG